MEAPPKRKRSDPQITPRTQIRSQEESSPAFWLLICVLGVICGSPALLLLGGLGFLAGLLLLGRLAHPALGGRPRRSLLGGLRGGLGGGLQVGVDLRLPLHVVADLR